MRVHTGRKANLALSEFRHVRDEGVVFLTHDVKVVLSHEEEQRPPARLRTCGTRRADGRNRP